MKKKLKIPKFKNEDKEREFWAARDVTDYVDAKSFVLVQFPNLKPTPYRVEGGISAGPPLRF